MTDLVEFIEARLTEDEQSASAAARELSGESWHEVISATWDDAGLIAGADVGYIARHDPARVLREVAAKRRLLAMRIEDEYGCVRARIGEFESCSDSCPGEIMDEVLKFLALPYADHPDYLAEWSPGTVTPSE